MNKRKLGDDVETDCVLFLSSQGITRIEKNYRNRNGEIDIVGYDKEYLVFFEVKYRKNITSGFAEESVSYTKQKQISRMSDFYRMDKKISDDMPMRFDVLAVNGKEIKWYKNAFDYIARKGF